MTKHLISAAVALLICTTSAFAVEYKWIGTIVIDNTTGCTTGWNPKGLVANALFRLPVSGSTNGPHSDLTIFDKTWASAFHLANGKFTTAFKPIQVTVIGTGTSSYNAQMRFSSQTPANIVTTTPFINVKAVLAGFGGLAGCNLSLSGTLTKSPF